MKCFNPKLLNTETNNLILGFQKTLLYVVIDFFLKTLFLELTVRGSKNLGELDRKTL